jgi:arylformamidase
MKIYDITQELFSSVVFPGDPKPQRQILNSMDEGGLYNLTALSMCAHNGTHIDAPYHFINEGKTIDEIPLDVTVGECFVTHFDGVVDGKAAEKIIAEAEKHSLEASKRILIGGNATVSEEAARVFADRGVLLLGNESQTVGPEDAPMAVHRILLGAGTVLLEGVRLKDVPDGAYLLSASPLLLSSADGSPCRAVLVECD